MKVIEEGIDTQIVLKPFLENRDSNFIEVLANHLEILPISLHGKDLTSEELFVLWKYLKKNESFMLKQLSKEYIATLNLLQDPLELNIEGLKMTLSSEALPAGNLELIGLKVEKELPLTKNQLLDLACGGELMSKQNKIFVLKNKKSEELNQAHQGMLAFLANSSFPDKNTQIKDIVEKIINVDSAYATYLTKNDDKILEIRNMVY